MFPNKSLYEKEKNMLLLLTDYPHSPNIIKVDDEKWIIVMEYVGKSLDLIYKRTKDRRIWTAHIMKAKHLLEKEFGVHQNDLRWKNTCLDEVNGKIYFVDWTKGSKIDNERNPEKIGDVNI